MADSVISTGIDGLIEYVNIHGEAEAKAIASDINVPEATVIEWANILEKANMIKIVNKSGKMFVGPL